MKYYIIFFLVFFKLATAVAPVYQDFWIVWNIGQGQWVTHVTAETCTHFDAGGEPGTFKKIRPKLVTDCGTKQNHLILSHWDMDHFLHIPHLAKTVPKLCWLFRPKFGATKTSVQKIMNLNLKNCAVQTPFTHWFPAFARTTNESAAVFMIDSVLLPGDSPISQENIWAENIEELKKIKVLILGHHGSRTSTGEKLLNHLPNLKWSVASARWAKYRHPHDQTLKRLYQKNIPVLRTEDWGTIRFETQK